MARSRDPCDRVTLCTSCDEPLTLDVSAKSVSCPHCHQRVITEPATVKDYMAVRHYKVANHVVINKKGIVVANVRADDLRVDGRLTGNVLSLQGLHVSKKAELKGDVRASWLVVDEGAVLVGHVHVGPDQVPELKKLRAHGSTDDVERAL